jgi:NTE family protein
VTDDKVLLLKLHPCSQNLSEEALEAIAQAAVLIRCEPGDYVCRAEEPIVSIYLIIHGRLRLYLLDVHGNVVIERFQTAGRQFGGLAASLTDPTPLNCVAVEPSLLLRLDYRTALKLSRKYSAFRSNCIRLIADSVKQVLLEDKTPIRPRVVAFFHQSDETRVVTDKLLSRLTEFGESCCVFSDQEMKVEGISERPIFGPDSKDGQKEIRQQVAECLHMDRVLLNVETSVDPKLAAHGFEACEHVFWCVTPDNWEASVSRLRRIQARAPAWRDEVSIVWLLPSGQDAPVATELHKLANRDLKISFDRQGANDGSVIQYSLDRLVHLLRGVQIGLALGGGAARGLAHLGVLKALQDSGITVDMIAGTSAGALTGMLYAAGFQPDYLAKSFASDLRPSWIFRCLPRGDQWYLLYKYRRKLFDPMLRKYLANRCVEQLPVPMHTISVDLISGTAVVRESGDAVHSIIESMNLPLLSKPINRDGCALVDGGLIDNVPADVLAQKGCNFVIAVSVTGKIELEFAGNRPGTPTAQMRSASTLETVLRGYLVQHYSINAIGVQPADIVIEPDVTRFELSDFAQAEELAAAGEEAALALVPQLQKLLHEMDSELFPLEGP